MTDAPFAVYGESTLIRLAGQLVYKIQVGAAMEVGDSFIDKFKLGLMCFLLCGGLWRQELRVGVVNPLRLQSR